MNRYSCGIIPKYHYMQAVSSKGLGKMIDKFSKNLDFGITFDDVLLNPDIRSRSIRG